jgi:hypothetical protein
MNDPVTDYESVRRLQKELGVGRIGDLLALSVVHDPFYAGMTGRAKEAEWFADIYRRFDFQPGYHLRRMHYRLVTNDPSPRRVNGMPYENTKLCWDELCRASTNARHLGLVRADAFEDHRNPDPIRFADYTAGETQPHSWQGDFLFWSLPSIGMQNREVEFSVPNIYTDGYDYSLCDQPYHLELWIEKSTMNDVLEPICREFHVNFVPGVGFQSITGAIRALQRIRWSACNKPTRIFYISDFDPAGDGMPVAVARHLEFYRPQYADVAQIKLTPIALTKAQVIKYRLPRVPIQENDSGRARFEDRYGEGAVELDALEALRPGRLAEIVRHAVKPYRDPDIESRLAETAAEAQQEAEQAWEEATQEQREELATLEEQIGGIAERYEQDVAALNARLQEELNPLRPRLDALRQAIVTAGEERDIELPERPEADQADVDESKWLFDSERTYVEQVRHYQQHKHGSNGRTTQARRK